MSMDISSEEYALYRELITYNGRNKVIGSGEAASISLAKKHNGVLGSNNLRDVSYYINKYSLKHITTGEILTLNFLTNFSYYLSIIVIDVNYNLLWSVFGG